MAVSVGISAAMVSGDICGLSGIWATRLCIQKFRSPAMGLQSAWAARELGNLGSFSGQNGPFEPGPYLSLVQSEGFELMAPL
jgi:hypothetical protein